MTKQRTTTSMDFNLSLNKFQKAADQLNKKILDEKQIEIAVVVISNAVCLKLYKKAWANPLQDPLTSESRIFFSVWINGSTMQEQKLWYNIHALKLRKLKGYSIESRKFADAFRVSFKRFEYKWQNVSVKFGPLTLMQGWSKIDPSDFQDEILDLANNFLEIEHLIDNTLTKFSLPS